MTSRFQPKTPPAIKHFFANVVARKKRLVAKLVSNMRGERIGVPRPQPYVVRCPNCRRCPPKLVMYETYRDRAMECSHCHHRGEADIFISFVPEGTLGVWAEERLG